MKNPYILRIGRAGLISLLLVSTSPADVFILKDGRRLEGSILSDREDSYLLEIQVTRSIKDELTIAKDEIASIEVQREDIAAFEPLADLVPVPNFLTPGQYRSRIRVLEQFADEFPKSDLREKAGEMAALHKEELAVIESGGIKIDGELVPAGERVANAYEIDSRANANEIMDRVENGRWLQALREFQLMEADFTGSKAWHSLLPTIQQVCDAHRTKTRQTLAGYEDRIDRQETGLSRMAIEEQQNARRAITRRDESLQRRYDAERKDRSYWPTPHPYFKPALEDTIRLADSEIRRLETAMNQPLPDPTPGQVWRDAYATIQDGEEREIRTAISAARSERMSPRYLEKLEQLAATEE